MQCTLDGGALMLYTLYSVLWTAVPTSFGLTLELSDSERRTLGVEPLPRSLNEALDVMEESKLARETLGEHVFEWFLRNKRAEWAEFQSKVTPFELERYLGNW